MLKTPEAPMLEYGPVYASADEPAKAPSNEPAGAPSDQPKRASIANEAVTWSVLIVCLAGWTVIGLFLWIPRVLRAVLMFSVALVQSTVAETGAASAGRRLRSAANFYRRGFVSAVESIKSPREKDEARQADEDGEVKIESGLILRETAWALFVWYLVLWWAGFPMLTPIDLLTMLAEVSWMEVWSGFFEGVASIPDLFRG